MEESATKMTNAEEEEGRTNPNKTREKRDSKKRRRKSHSQPSYDQWIDDFENEKKSNGQRN
jgi:hypothetical protein